MELSDAQIRVRIEIMKAVEKFPQWPTDPLHAIAVLNEEVGELNKAVLQSIYEPHKNEQDAVYKEAIQTAAMAMRFLMSINEYKKRKCKMHESPAVNVTPF